MYQYQCGRCGYDMTGIETFNNFVEIGNNTLAPFYIGSLGLLDLNTTNTLQCPNCGKVGHWEKH